MENKTNWPYEHEDLVCSVCRKETQSSDCELLEGTVLDALEVVLINLNLTTIRPVICKNCSKKILDAFENKSKWMYTEDQLFPYVTSSSDGKVDIKTVYLNENDLTPVDVQADTQICRLCLELINDNSWKMLYDVLEKQYSVEIFERYVPELNLSSTENPIICNMCLDSLSVFMGFITFYEDQEVKTDDYIEAEKESKPGGINSVVIEDMEQNKMEYNSRYSVEILKSPKCPHVSKSKTRLLKHGCINKTKKQARLFNLENHLLTHPNRKLYKCKTCNFRTKDKCYLRKHERRHQSALIHLQPIETEMFHCEFCRYNTKFKADLQKQNVVHKPLSEVEIFKCEFCTFETKHKRSLQQHILIHKPSSEVKVFKCELCTYERKRKGNLQHIRRHILIHKPPSEVKVFKCEFCTFETKYRGSIHNHLFIHKPASEVKVFKCALCTYEGKRKGTLQRHLSIHKPPFEVKVLKCEFCTFETKHKGSLHNHLLMHKPPSEVKVFKCELCTYEGKRKGSIRRHLLIHKPPSEVKVFKCELCTYKGKRKGSVQRHLLIHKPPSELKEM